MNKNTNSSLSYYFLSPNYVYGSMSTHLSSARYFGQYFVIYIDRKFNLVKLLFFQDTFAIAVQSETLFLIGGRGQTMSAVIVVGELVIKKTLKAI